MPEETRTDKVDAATRSRVMSAIRSKNNKSTERRMRALLVRAGIRGWRLHGKELPGRPDFVFDKEKLVIFVDGCFWHGCPQCFRPPKSSQDYWETKIDYNKSRDERNNLKLYHAGWRVLRFWEHELKNSAQVLSQIRQVLLVFGEPPPEGDC